MRRFPRLLLLLVLPPLLTGCLVPKKKYDALQAELDATRGAMTKELDDTRGRLTATEGDLAQARQRGVDLEAALKSEQARVATLGQQIAALNGEKAALLADRSKLKASVDEMQRALDDLAARKAEAEARVAEFKNLLLRFKKLIDAGKLRVKIVDGRMVVELATDVLFASGSAALSDGGKAAIVEVATVLASIPGRAYQVEGHTDDVPIKTATFPSNWELAAGRAITVVHAMIDAGLAPDRVAAASYSEYTPVRPNDTPEGRAANRRIEIVVVPDLRGLPGFDELEALDR